MIRKRFRIIAACLAISALTPLSAYAESGSSVDGEYVSLHSGGAPDSVTGNSYVNTLTEEQRQANRTNSTTSNSIRQKVGQYISAYQVETGRTIKTEDSYVFIIDQKVNIEELRSIIETAGNYTPVGYGYRIPIYTPGTADITAQDKDVFRRVVGNQLGGSANLSDIETNSFTKPIIDIQSTSGNLRWEDIVWTAWERDRFGSLQEFIAWLIEQGGQRIRVDIDGGFIDFTDMETRYQMLDAYLNAALSSDNIEVQYVLEYRIENTAHDAVYRMVGQNGMYSYTWLFENQDTGEAYYRYNMASSIYHQFMRKGTYSIDVDKEVYKTFCDAFTFSLNEYWIIEETGQVIWKQETQGKNIDPTIPALELGFRNMVMYNTPAEDDMPSMETIDVAAMTHVVTDEMLGLTIPAEGSFREFYTERIQ